MKTLAAVSLIVIFALALTTPALAGKTVTLEGQVLCAKCSLHEEGRQGCQNVLKVEKKKGKEQLYYMARNDVYEQYGEVCKSAKSVRVTGEVEKKDGKMWIAATEITPIEQGS